MKLPDRMSKTLDDALSRAIERAVAKLPVKAIQDKLEFIERQNRRVFFSTSTYLGDYTAETWITSGQRILVDTRDLGIARHLMFKGFWEKTSNEAFRSLLDEDSVFVDIGAHYGFHTITCAQKASKGRVIAVEPNPRVHSLLTKSVRINQLRDRVTIHRCAISDEPAELLFVCPSDDPALGHLLPPDTETGEDDAERALVAVRSLDDLLADVSRIDLMKIDVEGHELQALRGGRSVLAAHPGIRLALEYAPAHIERQTSLEEFHAELRDQGFEHVYEIDPRGKLQSARYEELGESRRLRNLILSRGRI